MNDNCTTLSRRAPEQKSLAASDRIRHLYAHIPFCARICPYCAFYKERLERSQTQRFCDAIVQEIRDIAAQHAIVPETIFFGGGTPTALTTVQLKSLLGGIRELLDLSQLTEWTIEANPGSVSARKAASLAESGVNRVSLGVQSWDDNLLRVLGREHDARQAEQSFETLRRAGFININIDLMFGLPGQTVAQWKTTLEKTIALAPEHVSAYCLTYEEDTDFFLRHARGELCANGDEEADFFALAMTTLEAAGFQQYEISNYARENRFSRHNCAYWAGENYIGIGPSAFSTLDNRRWQNVCDYRAYADRVLSGGSAVASVEDLTGAMKKIERIALGLRTSQGVPAAVLGDQSNRVAEFVALGLLRASNERLVLTAAGKSLADSVAEAFV